MYDELCKYRDESVDGLQGWLWIATDNDAWSGPKTDWEDHHSKKWFSHVKSWDYCVQGGGCQGVYPRLLSERFGIVITYEPDPLNFHCLVNNCQRDNIIKLNAAMGDKHGLVSVIRSGMTNTGMHRVGNVDGSKGHIPMIPIDDLMLPSCGLIAFDLEGYEIYALKGALRTIESFLPVITAETVSDEFRTVVTSYGYKQVAQSVSDTVFAVV